MRNRMNAPLTNVRHGTKYSGYWLAYDKSPVKYHYHNEQTERIAKQQAMTELHILRVNEVKDQIKPIKMDKIRN